ncbi:MAG: PaaI family thioesterase [bacterium]|nr:MAG: PaaI family thioesterase [bacterium]
MCRPDWEVMMDPGGDPPFELDSWVNLAPFERTLGMEITEAGGGEALLTMPFTVKLAQGMGLLHGGALTSLADTAAAMAIKTVLPEGTHFATVALRTEFFSPVRGGVVSARARAVKEDDRTFRGEVSVADDSDREIARFVSTFKVAKGRG